MSNDYEYALRSPDGRYYTGRVNHDAEPEAWLGTREQAFMYTLPGANVRLASAECFNNFSVEKVR